LDLDVDLVLELDRLGGDVAATFRGCGSVRGFSNTAKAVIVRVPDQVHFQVQV